VFRKKEPQEASLGKKLMTPTEWRRSGGQGGEPKKIGWEPGQVGGGKRGKKTKKVRNPERWGKGGGD